jgi:hypothetical protein
MDWNKMMGKNLLVLVSIALFFSFLGVAVGQEVTVCCEKTSLGFSCQDIPSNECASDSRKIPTSCESTSFCKLGFCFDSSEGTCLDGTPQITCNENGGTWSEEFPPQCELGCCILGDQAAFVTLTRCKALSAQLGLHTNYNKEFVDEVQCVLSAASQEKGACVFDFEFERTCKFSTRSECEQGNEEAGSGVGEFFKDKLCSDEELGTNCGPSRNTACVDGKDGIYFLDTCGNPANIYDASKINDKEYWANVKSVAESCGSGSNSNSQGCGNCNYIEGSVCRPALTSGVRPTYGENICVDLNCDSVSSGGSYRHGESWCVFNDEGEPEGNGEHSVGSRFYRHICVNGEEIVEGCADFRQETCIQDDIDGFSQAACRVNRWQDCAAQITQFDCENTDRRDCLWKEDYTFSNRANPNEIISEEGLCIPKNPPGLNFWEGTESLEICAQANDNCLVRWEKTEKIIGGDDDWKCVENCECLDEEWFERHKVMCVAFGDCGSNVNWIREKGAREGFNLSRTRFVAGQDAFAQGPVANPSSGISGREGSSTESGNGDSEKEETENSDQEKEISE